MHVDLLIKNITQLATCAAEGPKRGEAMRDVGIIAGGAVAVRDGIIVAVGETAQLAGVTADKTINAAGKAVVPGFVDSHTHTIFGGDRAHEFEMRIQGATYMEIMAAGGGIVSTMRHTREATEAALVTSARKRLDEMLALGSTTVEIKTGYGLDVATELKMLRVMAQLDAVHPCDIVPTFLGAHTVPPEFTSAAGTDTEGYVQLVINEMLPEVVNWYQSSRFAANKVPLFIDVFCEDHALNVDQSRRILQAGIDAGLQAKLHVDQFNAFGGVKMAVNLGAMSVDHLDVTSEADIARLANSQTMAVPLPAVNFNLNLERYADARRMIDAGTAVALATDLNPGSAPCPSMPLVMAIACRVQKLLPAEALNAATINAACAVGLGERLGSIQVGKQADLLILNAADYRHIPYFFGGNPVETVIKKGEVTGHGF
ncbi:MAG: imidazolonepropionase [Anaerolineales bacterium]|nr:imidazolonepropionase [Anaerolineales bacterium]